MPGRELPLFDIRATSLAAGVEASPTSTAMNAQVSRDKILRATRKAVIYRLCVRYAQPSTAESPCTTEGNMARPGLGSLSIPAITKTRAGDGVRLTYNGLVHEGLRLRIVEEERPRPAGQDYPGCSQQDGLQRVPRRAPGQVL